MANLITAKINKNKTVEKTYLSPTCGQRGMLNRIGERFGTLTAKFPVRTVNKVTIWNLLCDCGQQVERNLISLQYVKNVTCPECRLKNNHYNWKGVGEISLTVFNSYKDHASEKGFVFDITHEFVWNLYLNQQRKCALTGWDIKFNKSDRGRKDRTASLDRIDSTKGYTEDNVQWVHREVNMLKGNMDNEKFVSICLAIAKNNDSEIS